MERVKKPRYTVRSFVAARRFRGQDPSLTPEEWQPMLAYYYARSYKVSPKEVQGARPAPPQKWFQATVVAGAEATPYVTGHTGPRPGSLYWDKMATDLFYNVDGFTVYEKKDKSLMTHKVFVAAAADPMAPISHPDVNPDKSSISKQHYFVLTGPGGCVAVFAVKSGSKLKGKRAMGDFQWWWDVMAQYLTAADLQRAGIDENVQELRDKFANKHWEVCLSSCQAV